ncbi:MAG: hypothetical protein HGB22_05025 [Chlorobiaceae bacterium]|nr:hypothetical protein [Chlorobiaceae bacterium]
MKSELLKKALLAATLFLGATPAAFAGTGDLAIGLKGGTLGIGGEATMNLVPGVNVRSGFNTLNYTGSASKSDIDYKYKLKLQTIPVLLDLHPIADSGFRLSSGILINNNKVTATGKSQASYKIGDQTYSASDIGTLTGNIDFNKVSPYAGIGWGNAVSRHSSLTFSCDLGVMFQGTPKVSLAASNPITAADPLFKAELDKEIAKVKDSTDSIKYYPVVSIGLAYAF